RRETDRIPPEQLRHSELTALIEDVNAHYHSGTVPGELTLEDSRLVIDLPEPIGRFFVIPTTGNWTCYLVGTDTAARCVDTMTSGLAWAVNDLSDGAIRRIRLHGLAADNVTKVALRVGQLERSAVL